MSTKTTNYNLIKPATTDTPDITAMNSNWDIIDTKLKEAMESGGSGSSTVEGDYLPLAGGTVTGETTFTNDVDFYNTIHETLQFRTWDAANNEYLITAVPQHAGDEASIWFHTQTDSGSRISPRLRIGDPVDDDDAATKKYVDEAVGDGKYLPITGGTVAEEGNDVEFGEVTPYGIGLFYTDSTYESSVGIANLSETTEAIAPTIKFSLSNEQGQAAGEIMGVVDLNGSNVIGLGADEPFVSYDFAGARLKGITEPIDDCDAVNKTYLDNRIPNPSGLSEGAFLRVANGKWEAVVIESAEEVNF